MTLEQVNKATEIQPDAVKAMRDRFDLYSDVVGFEVLPGSIRFEMALDSISHACLVRLIENKAAGFSSVRLYDRALWLCFLR